MSSKEVPITKRQKEVLTFIESYHSEHGYCPTLNEIMKNFDLTSLGTVHKHVDLLAKKGYLIKTKSQVRGLTLKKLKSIDVARNVLYKALIDLDLEQEEIAGYLNQFDFNLKEATQ